MSSNHKMTCVFRVLKIHLNLIYLLLHFSNERTKLRTPTQKYDNIYISQISYYHHAGASDGTELNSATGMMLATNGTYICHIMPIVLQQNHSTDGQAHHYEASSPLRRENKI